MEQNETPGISKMDAAIDEGKRNAEQAQEELLNAACELCHYPFYTKDQEELASICEFCPLPPLLDKCLLLERTNMTVKVLRIVAEEMLKKEGGVHNAGSEPV